MRCIFHREGFELEYSICDELYEEPPPMWDTKLYPTWSDLYQDFSPSSILGKIQIKLKLRGNEFVYSTGIDSSYNPYHSYIGS